MSYSLRAKKLFLLVGGKPKTKEAMNPVWPERLGEFLRLVGVAVWSLSVPSLQTESRVCLVTERTRDLENQGPRAEQGPMEGWVM